MLQSVGYNAFNGCKGIVGVYLPDTLQSIDAEAFYGCVGLATLVLPTLL